MTRTNATLAASAVGLAVPMGALLLVTLGTVSSGRAAELREGAGRHGLDLWVARKITDEKREKKAIEALLDELHTAYRKGDQEAAAARMQFPVLVVTDDWKDEPIAHYWDREKWMQATKPLFEQPAPDLERAHHHRVFVLSDSLAAVEDEQSVRLGRRKVNIRSATILVRKDRSWFVQATVEGGWGDTPVAGSEPVPPPSE